MEWNNKYRMLQFWERWWKMSRILLLGCLLLLCHFCVKSCVKINAARDLEFLHDFSQVQGNESDLFDYICRSRFWTVENQVKADRICAFSNKEGKVCLFPWGSSSSILIIYQNEFNLADSIASVANGNSMMKSGRSSLMNNQELNLSGISTFIVNEHEPNLLFSWKFKKSVVSYLSGVVRDIEAGTIDERLALEKSLRVGSSYFGAEDISIICGDAILGGNKMRGWINVGKRGPVHAKLYDAASGKRIGESKASRTNQYVGFDANPSKKFFFEIPLDVDGGGELVEARVELYSGLDNTLLFQTNAVLQTWVR